MCAYSKFAFRTKIDLIRVKIAMHPIAKFSSNILTAICVKYDNVPILNALIVFMKLINFKDFYKHVVI